MRAKLHFVVENPDRTETKPLCLLLNSTTDEAAKRLYNLLYVKPELDASNISIEGEGWRTLPPQAAKEYEEPTNLHSLLILRDAAGTVDLCLTLIENSKLKTWRCQSRIFICPSATYKEVFAEYGKPIGGRYRVKHKDDASRLCETLRDKITATKKEEEELTQKIENTNTDQQKESFRKEIETLQMHLVDAEHDIQSLNTITKIFDGGLSFPAKLTVNIGDSKDEIIVIDTKRPTSSGEGNK